MAKNLIGIEVGNAKLIIYSTSGMVVRDLPEGVIENHAIADENKFSEFLAEVVKEEKISGRDVAFVLPDDSTFFVTLNLAPMSDQELKLNLPYEFRDYVGDESDGYFYDYAMNDVEYDEEGSAVSMELFAAAGRKDIIAQLESVLKAAGLRLSTALPREMCLINIFREAKAEERLQDEEYFLIDIGTKSTRFYVLKDAKLVGNRTIDFGAAEQYEDDAQKQADYDKLGLEIMKAMNFYKYQHQDSEIDEVFFCGTQCEKKTLRASLLRNLDVKERRITDVLPESAAKTDGAFRGIAAIGATL